MNERDIVDRLADACDETALCREAAGEIECLREENERLKRLAGYLAPTVGSGPGGSEVDRLKRIIHDLDAQLIAALKERNDYWSRLKEKAEECCRLEAERPVLQYRGEAA